MSFLAGSLAGALVTGGSHSIAAILWILKPDTDKDCSTQLRVRTSLNRVPPTLTRSGGNVIAWHDSLHDLSERLVNASVLMPSPLPASARIVERPFTTMLQERWNDQVEHVFRTVGSWERRASDRGRKVLYGETSTST